MSRHTITANGDAKNERIQPNARMVAAGNVHIIGPKVGSSAIWFDGSGDYLSAPDHADWALGSGDFTLEAWAVLWMIANENLFFEGRLLIRTDFGDDPSESWYFLSSFLYFLQVLRLIGQKSI